MKNLFQANRLKQDESMQLAELEILIIRSKRKSISLQIKPEGIILRAPLYSPRVMLKAFALSKINWLRKHHSRLKEHATINNKEYCDGEQWLLFGKPITLKIISGIKSETQYFEDHKEIHITVGPRVKNREKFIQRRLNDFYKEIALQYLYDKAPVYAKEMNLNYKNITVREYKSRWGSCSSNGNLSFNWRIFMAPEEVIDSVVVHELAHLAHFNHSKRFWQLVLSICPDYERLHEWLKEHQYQLQA